MSSNAAPADDQSGFEQLDPTDRIAATSDGVFAVALTLLILDVRPPDGSGDILTQKLVAVAPRLGVFALSFAINDLTTLVKNVPILGM